MNKKIGKALVVGAGISGIRAALDLAETGYGVTLIDRAPHLGGILSQLDYQFPTDRCGMCKMLPLVDRDASSQYCLRKGLFHENIEILLSTEISSVQGEPGNFAVMLHQKPAWVDQDLCTGCGACVQVCPVEVPDLFNTGLASRKAIYLPVPHSIPNSYVIDVTACSRCGACDEVCPTQAIRLSQQERKKFRILVVDDELILRDSLKAWLDDEEGFAVDTAGSGQQALELLEKSTYNIMLLDIKMPGMDGVEVLKKAKEAFPDLNVVMMTAYATVETAVEAMKIGAFDYLIKPFDPDTLIPKILGIYEKLEATRGRELQVGAIVLCGGTAYFDPATGKDTFGYGIYPNVVTSLEFERILSGTGPYQGKLVRPGGGKPIKKVAWIQCVGSRDMQTDADFCSNICCMYAIKEALVAKEKTNGKLEATIFYMDMRCFGKSFQRYRDRAETDHGVCFKRGRVHSVITDNTQGETSDDLILRYVDLSGKAHDEKFDMAVLAVGQRPSPGTAEFSEMLGIDLNEFGFCQVEPFSYTKTGKEGIVIGGSFSGLKDISESVIQASSASLTASCVIHASGGSLTSEPSHDTAFADVSKDMPKVMVAVCTCGDVLSKIIDTDQLTTRLMTDPEVDQVVFIEQTCTADGWESLVELVEKHEPNRILIAACLPYVYARKIRELGNKVGLDPALIDVVDIHTPLTDKISKDEEHSGFDAFDLGLSTIEMGIAGLKHLDPTPVATVPVFQRALVVGGGIAGMTAALAVADHGFEVDLLEQGEVLGGNLNWLKQTLEGHLTQTLLDETLLKVEKHSMIQVHTRIRLTGSYGQVGRFYTSIEDEDGVVNTLEHGVTILATGGAEAGTASYGYGTSEAIITQMELEIKLSENKIDPGQLESVVMIQCVDSRQEPRNYCSRVCCSTSIKQALQLKEQNPDLAIYIFYRDIMTYGFTESYYTQARKTGIIFIQYDIDKKPQMNVAGGSDKPLRINAFDPILGRDIEINADLAVLATGVVPSLPDDLAQSFGATVDEDGFFQEAESKWRPVDSLKEGIFACGLAHSPRSIPESIATAEAAAQRALRILSRENLPAGKVVAKVRHSICSLCELCIEVCPYGARTIDIDLEQVLVNPVMCQGCGSCAAVCPSSASILEGFTIRRMFDVIDAAMVGTLN